ATDSSGNTNISEGITVTVSNKITEVMELIPPSKELTICPGDSQVLQLTIKNTGEEFLKDIYLEVNGTKVDPLKDWVTLDKDQIDYIPPDGKDYINPTVKVPYDAKEGTYRCNIQITANVSEKKTISRVFNITVKISGVDWEVVLNEINETIYYEKTIPIPIKNSGCTALKNVRLVPSPEIKKYLKFNKDNIDEISTGATVTIVSTVSKPNESRTVIGSINIISDNGGSKLIPVTLVLVYKTVIIKPNPLSITTIKGVTKPATISVKNRGISDIANMHFQPQGTISDWIKFNSNDITIKKNTEKYVVMEVTPPQNADTGNYECQVVVSYEQESLILDLDITIIEMVSSPLIVKPDSLNLLVQSGYTETGTLNLTDMSKDTKQIFFRVTGDIYNILTLDKSDIIFSGDYRNAALKYTVTIPSGISGEWTGAIEITGAVTQVIPVTLSTTLPQQISVVSIKDQIATIGESIKVPIEITNAKDIGSMDILMTYESEVLTPISVEKGSLTQNSNIASNITNAGTIAISLMDLSGFTGDGSIAIITFKVKAGNASPLLLKDIKATDTNFNKVAINKESGLIIIETNKCGITGDLNGDMEVTSVDALMALQMAVGNIPVDKCADVSCDGEVTSVDALMILQASVGNLELKPC
ncbi:MAG: cohesin domain-containing protein, partial [Methanosarcinales archaeon]